MLIGERGRFDLMERIDIMDDSAAFVCHQGGSATCKAEGEESGGATQGR
jgi:hypothetical protein